MKQLEINFEVEIWADIPNYESLYQASTWGRIKSWSNGYFRRERILKPCTKKNSYKMVLLQTKNVKKHVSVHRLIALTFIPNPENKATVNHINGNKSDNRLSNLEWATNSENSTHYFMRTKKSSKYMGVTWDKHNKKWRTVIFCEGKNKFLGYFVEEMDAGNAYINFRQQNG